MNDLVERFPEINPNNYNHDDVVALNLWAIEAASALEASGRDAWRPIETAPKDGTWVLLAGGDVNDDSGESRMAVAQWTNELNGRKTDWHWQHCWYDGGYYGWYENPTHWMPLPAAPEAVPTIDLDAESWKSIKEAASKSPWIPKEYYMNDWVSDVCAFLLEPERTAPDAGAGGKDCSCADIAAEIQAGAAYRKGMFPCPACKAAAQSGPMVSVPRETLAPFLAAAKRMDGYSEGLATQVTTEVVKGRVVFALDSLWVKHWRELLDAAAP